MKKWNRNEFQGKWKRRHDLDDLESLEVVSSLAALRVFIYLSLNQLVMWKQTSVSYSTTHIAYPSWFFTRTSQCSIKMKKKKMNTWNKINMDTQKIQMIQWRILFYESNTHFPHWSQCHRDVTPISHWYRSLYRRGVYVTTTSTDMYDMKIIKFKKMA